MAVLVAVGGAALTSALGLGWQAGWIAGAAVGGLLFGGGRQTVRGPRLRDPRVTSAAYGAPINRVYGTMRVPGQLIWSGGIREHKHTRSAGKGGGTRTVTYTYTASFAVAFCAGPADILRLWFDGKLVYDRRSPGETTVKPGLRFRVYRGDEEQLPDPAIEAGNAPAHRGLCYVVFDEVPLGDYGNRVPTVSAEVASAVTSSNPVVYTTWKSGGSGSYDRSLLAIDWERGYLYLWDSYGDPAQAYLRRVDLRTMTEDRQLPASEVAPSATSGSATAFGIGRDGSIYVSLGSSNSHPIYRIDPGNLRATAEFGYNSTGLSNTTDNFTWPAHFAPIMLWGPDGPEHYLLVASQWTDIGVLKGDDLTYVWGSGQALAGNDVSLCRGAAGEGYGEAWALTTDGSLGRLYRVRVEYGAHYNAATGMHYGVDASLEASFAPSDIEPGGSSFYRGPKCPVYDPGDGGIVMFCEVDTQGNGYAFKYVPGQGIVWVTPINYAPNYADDLDQHRLDGTRFVYWRQGTAYVLDLRTGQAEEIAVPSLDAPYGYDFLSHSVVGSSDTGFVRVYLGRAAGDGALVGDIVADVCGLVGLGAGDVDASELSDTVPGYVLAGPTEARAALEPLARVYAFDAVESDDVLAFRKRGRAPVATLGEQDMLVLDPETGEAVRERRAQEVELPARVSLTYADPAQDYSPGTQQAARPSAPVPASGSRHHLTLEVPAALAAADAKAAATRLLYAAWSERSAYELRLLPRWLRLEPSDVVLLPVGSATVRARVVRADVGADLSLRVEAVAEEPAVWDASAVADAGVPSSQVLPVPEPARLLIPQLPLLRDEDDTGGNASRVYYAAGAYRDGWRGGLLYRSADRSSWAPGERLASSAAWGYALNALPAPATPWATDEDSALTVSMVVGGDLLASVTQEQMCNGANAAALVRADGFAELIQFRDVQDNGDGTYTLRGLLRGRRGTEPYCEGHAAGDLFVLLDAETWGGALVAPADIGLTRYWRLVPDYALLEATEVVARQHAGLDLWPYAPAHLRASLAGSDVLLAWTRRTRVGGELRDGTGEVPLGEQEERYDAELAFVPGSAAVRSWTGLAEPQVTWTATEIAADAQSFQPLALTNGGFETGDLTGWTAVGTAPSVVQSDGNATAYEGSWCCNFSSIVGASAEIQQDVALGAYAYGGAELRISAYVAADVADTDTLTLAVDWLDGAGASLGTSTGTPVDPPDDGSWALAQEVFAVPAGAATARVRLIATRNAGSYINVLVDAVTVEARFTGTPSAVVLRVWQVSATVGRGHKAEAVVPIS